jgi:multiple sugar transport system ATP-binding protein
MDGVVPFLVRVTRVENLGADRLLYGVLEGAFADARILVKLTSRIPIQQGELRRFGARESDLRFFDTATGLRTGARPMPQ